MSDATWLKFAGISIRPFDVVVRARAFGGESSLDAQSVGHDVFGSSSWLPSGRVPDRRPVGALNVFQPLHVVVLCVSDTTCWGGHTTVITQVWSSQWFLRPMAGSNFANSHGERAESGDWTTSSCGGSHPRMDASGNLSCRSGSRKLRPQRVFASRYSTSGRTIQTVSCHSPNLNPTFGNTPTSANPNAEWNRTLASLGRVIPATAVAKPDPANRSNNC